jgi:hypothetical protein
MVFSTIEMSCLNIRINADLTAGLEIFASTYELFFFYHLNTSFMDGLPVALGIVSLLTLEFSLVAPLIILLLIC